MKQKEHKLKTECDKFSIIFHCESLEKFGENLWHYARVGNDKNQSLITDETFNEVPQEFRSSASLIIREQRVSQCLMIFSRVHFDVILIKIMKNMYL